MKTLKTQLFNLLKSNWAKERIW